MIPCLRVPCAAALSFATIAVTGARLPAQPDQATRPPRVALAEPSLSADGREIAFVAAGDIWSVPVEGGVARLLVAHAATESRPLWSPDGTHLAFVSTRTGGGDIYVLQLSTGAVRRLTFDDGREQLDAWSPDGAWIYYSSASGDIAGMNDVWRVPSAGGQPMPVAADRYASEYWASPSPDGRALAITARGTVAGQWWRNGHSHLDESELWLVRDLDRPAPTYVPFGEAGGGKDAWPMWSPDGAAIFYMSDRSGHENLWARAVSGGGARQLTRFTSGRVLWPQMGRDGRAIVFERDFGIWHYDVASSDVREVPITLRGAVAEVPVTRQLITDGFGALAVAPDGRKVAFTARGELFVAGARDAGEARRLTSTAEVESDPAWLPDSRRLVYAATRGAEVRIVLHDVAGDSMRELTRGARDGAPRVSPDGRWIAYQRHARELRIVGIDGRGDRAIAEAVFRRPPFASASDVTWSPDSRWVAWLATGPRGYGNAWVAPADGGAPRQVSFLADANAGNIVWSGDGTFLLHRTGQRTETPRIVRIDLVPRVPRFREDQFRDLFAPATTPPAPARDSAARPATDTTARGRSGARAPVVVDVADIRRRATIIDLNGLDVGSFALSPDGRTLVFGASPGGQSQLYTLSLDPLARGGGQPRALTTSAGGKGAVQWSADGRDIWFLEGGRIAAVAAESRQPRTVAVTAEVEVDFDAEKQALFAQAWQYLADNFYDERMHGVDWPAVRDRVAPYVAASRTPDELRRVLSLMVGELNASHLGVSGPAGGVTLPVGRLGVRFDRLAHERAGEFRIAEVVEQGPASVAGLRVGERIRAIDGIVLERRHTLDSLLAGRVGRRVVLSVTAAGGGATREVVLQPVATAAEKALLYRQWVEERRAYVARVSNGRLGYVHMFDMGQGSLDQLHLDLDADNQQREGVVIDVRNNNGGFVNPYAIDVFARRGYLQFTSRGEVTSPARASLGQRTLERPTVLVTNQHSLSDAEDFTEGYRALGLGTVVGEPTAGWIIFTSNVTLLDGSTTLRLPTTRVSDAQGRTMELVPRPVDVAVTRPVGESYQGRDRQLDAAVATLLERLSTGGR